MPVLRPHVSVILPVFNMAEYLADSLKGLLAQEGLTQHDEIVVVDNDSTDRSVEIAQCYRGVRVLHQPKRGSYAARNLGIRSTTGEVIIFLDPDCRPKPGWLAAVLESLRDPETQMVLGKRNYGHLNTKLFVLAAYENQKIEWVLSQSDPSLVYGYTNNMAVRRSIFDRFGLFEERMRGGDTLFVQNVVHSLGVSVARYNPRMAVDHMEITSVAEHYRKLAIYGANNERLTSDVRYRALSNRQRLSVFAALARRRILNPLQLGLLLTLLVPGALIYEWGRRNAK